MKIIEQPYDLAQLRDLSREGSRRISAVLAVAWQELPNLGQEALEEYLTRKMTGSRYGLADLEVELVGILDHALLLEVSGDVGMLLNDYDAIMAEEAGEVCDERHY